MIIKRLCAIVVCLALGGGWAFAQAMEDIRCWTAKKDEHYHMRRDCAGHEVFPISENAALAFGKTACEICVEIEAPDPVQDPADLRLAARSGTYVLCIPCGSLEDIAMTDVKEPPVSRAFVQEEAWAQLGGMMSGDKCDDIRRRLEADHWAYDSCRVPEPALDEDTLSLSARLIDDCWYFVFRPEKALGSEAEIGWRVEEWDIRIEEYGTLTITNALGADCLSRLKVESHSDAEVVFEKDFGGVDITVYREQGLNTAVLHAEKSSGGVRSGRLFIGGKDTGDDLNGYINARKQATYCCVIGDAELAGIVAGRDVEIRF